jgi:hypothetical protein
MSKTPRGGLSCFCDIHGWIDSSCGAGQICLVVSLLKSRNRGILP